MPKTVTEEAREEMRMAILNTAYDLIRENGLTHTSIDKITNQCKIGKGTFYLYFQSKEALIVELMLKQGRDSLRDFQNILGGRDKMSPEEGREYIKYVITRDDTVYRYLPNGYLKKLKAAFPEQWEFIQPGDRTETIEVLLTHIEGVRHDVDVRLVSDLMRVFRIAFQNLDDSIEQAEKIDMENSMYSHLFSLIFN